jgi:hypothetical protein
MREKGQRHMTAYTRAIQTVLPSGAALLVSLYIGVAGLMAARALATVTPVLDSPTTNGGFIYDKIHFRDLQSVKEFIAERRIIRFAPWVFSVGNDGVLFFGCLGFGMFGGASRWLWQNQSGRSVTQNGAARMLLGGVVGVIAWALGLTLPSVFLGDRGPVALIGIALLAGVFSELFYVGLRRAAARIFGAGAKGNANGANA